MAFGIGIMVTFKVGADVVERSQCIMMYIVVACHLKAIFGIDVKAHINFYDD